MRKHLMTSWNLRFFNLRILKFKCLRSEIFFIGAIEIIFLVLKVLSTPQNGQHNPTIRQQQPTNGLSVFDYFVWLALKGLKNKIAKIYQTQL